MYLCHVIEKVVLNNLFLSMHGFGKTWSTVLIEDKYISVEGCAGAYLCAAAEEDAVAH